MGKKALLFEGGKTKSLDADVIGYGTAGAVNVMRYLNMLDGDPSISTPPKVIRKTKWLRAPSSGIFFPEDVNGQFVAKRTLLGTIKDPYGDYQKPVLAPYPGHIICANTTSIVNRGDALFHMSRDEE